MTDDLLTTGEAARLLGTTSRRVREWCAAGKVPGWRTPGGHWKLHRSVVEKMLNERREALTG